jgi:fructuronate reductase
MTAARLTQLSDVTGTVALPEYEPAAHGVGIVHLGLGAFHRAHQAVMTDAAISKMGGDWRIIGVSLRSRAIATALEPQNGRCGSHYRLYRGGYRSRSTGHA